jgi:hypothetical protein
MALASGEGVMAVSTGAFPGVCDGLVNGFARSFLVDFRPHPGIALIAHRHQIARDLRHLPWKEDWASGRKTGMNEGPIKSPETPEMDSAIKHLEAAIGRLEGRLDGLFSRLEGHRMQQREADALRVDRARLASDLDAARARERELQRLADEASEALGAAISEVREALGKV